MRLFLLLKSNKNIDSGRRTVKRFLLIATLFFGSFSFCARRQDRGRNRVGRKRKKVQGRRRSGAASQLTTCEKVLAIADGCTLIVVGLCLAGKGLHYLFQNQAPLQKFERPLYIPDALIEMALKFPTEDVPLLVNMYSCEGQPSATTEEMQAVMCRCNEYYGEPSGAFYESEKLYEKDDPAKIVPSEVSEFAAAFGDPYFTGAASPLVEMYGCAIDGRTEEEMKAQMVACMDGNLAELLDEKKAEQKLKLSAQVVLKDVALEEEVQHVQPYNEVASAFGERKASRCYILDDEIHCE